MVEKKPRVRMTKEERREMLLERAIELFAENGFDASTHQLAEALGVTQPLIYRYFSSKEHLLEEVYTSLLEGHFKTEWSQLIADRTVPLVQRLVQFYKIYGEVTQSRTWLRLYLYSGLRSVELNRRYIKLLEKNIIRVIASELRHELDLPPPDELSISDEELEVVWNFHTGLFYFGVRKEVFELSNMPDFAKSIERIISVFVSGYRSQFP